MKVGDKVTCEKVPANCDAWPGFFTESMMVFAPLRIVDEYVGHEVPMFRLENKYVYRQEWLTPVTGSCDWSKYPTVKLPADAWSICYTPHGDVEVTGHGQLRGEKTLKRVSREYPYCWHGHKVTIQHEVVGDEIYSYFACEET